MKMNTAYEYALVNPSNKLRYAAEYTEQAFLCILVAHFKAFFNFPDHTN